MSKKERTPLDILAELLKNPSHHLSIDVYNEDAKTIKEPNVKKHKSKYTLNQIGDMVVGIKEDVKQINIRLDHVEARLDYYGLQIEQINKRLDYNNLKKLPINN